MAGTLAAHILAGAAAHDGCPLIFVTGDGEYPTTLGALVSDAERVAGAMSPVYSRNGPGARHLGLFPPGHMAGLTSLLRTLLRGTPGVIMQSWDAALAASLIDRHLVTSSAGAPVQLSGLLDRQASGAASLATLAEFLTRRWFRTGDIGRLDGDGRLTVTDRLKDIIIRGGENISSKEVEDLLVTHPAVADAAVIAAPDPVLGERVCAVVVLRQGQSFDVGEAGAHFAAAGAARQKTPEVVMLTDELPRTPSGKVRKDVLRARLAAGTGPSPA